MDTDDGSAYLRTYRNVMVYGDNGLKSDFGGHDNKWHGNLLLYVGNCCAAVRNRTPAFAARLCKTSRRLPVAADGSGFARFSWGWPGYNDAFENNTCVFRTSYGSSCGRDARFVVRANQVYSKDGTLKVCGGKVDFAEWQEQGHDVASSLGRWPSDAALVKQARELLGF